MNETLYRKQVFFTMQPRILHLFLQDHCESHNTIKVERVTGKKEIRGYVEQLLINKTTMLEVLENRRNLVSMWLDYERAFNSVKL